MTSVGCRFEEQTSATLLEQRVSYGMFLVRLLCKGRFAKKPEGGQSGATGNSGETGGFLRVGIRNHLLARDCRHVDSAGALSARQRPVLEIPSIRTLNPFPPFPQSIVSERKCVNCEQSIVFMSSTGQATSSHQEDHTFLFWLYKAVIRSKKT